MDELLFLGVLLSLLYTELTGLSPGGIIVPAYIVLFWGDPLRIALTIGLSLLCLLIVRGLSNFMILYGRRRFALYLLIGMALKALFSFAFAESPIAIPNLSLSIGILIPGLLANDMEKQRFLPTLLSLGVVVGLLRLVHLVFLR